MIAITNWGMLNVPNGNVMPSIIVQLLYFLMFNLSCTTNICKYPKNETSITANGHNCIWVNPLGIWILRFTNSENLSPANWTCSLSGWPPILHGYCLSILHFPFGTAFHTISLHRITSFSICMNIVSCRVNRDVRDIPKLLKGRSRGTRVCNVLAH